MALVDVARYRLIRDRPGRRRGGHREAAGRGGDLVQPEDHGGGDHRHRHHQVAHARHRGDGVGVHRRGGEEREAGGVGRRQVGAGGRGLGPCQRAEVVDDGVDRRPQGEPDQAHAVAFEELEAGHAAEQDGQQQDERKYSIQHGLDAVPHQRQRFGRDPPAGDLLGVQLGHRLGAGDAEQRRRGILGLLAHHQVGFLHRVDHRVLLQDLGRGRGRIGDAGAHVGRRQLGIDGRGGGDRRHRAAGELQRRIGLDAELGEQPADRGRHAVVDLGVGHWTRRGCGDAGDRVGDAGEARRIGGRHQRPQVGRGGEGLGRDEPLRDIVEGAVLDEAHHVGAEERIGEADRARALDQMCAEHQAMIAEAQFVLEPGGRGQDLECGLEEIGQGVADRTHDTRLEGEPEGHVVDDRRRRVAGLVHHLDGGLGQEQHQVDQDHAHQPLRSHQPVRRQRRAEEGTEEADHEDQADRGQEDVAVHDRCERVEEPHQGVDVAVAEDFVVHGDSPALPCPSASRCPRSSTDRRAAGACWRASCASTGRHRWRRRRSSGPSVRPPGARPGSCRGR